MLQQINQNLRNPVTAINENFRALSPASLFAVDLSRSVGLTFAYYGGVSFVSASGGGYVIAPDGTLSLPPNEADVFVEVDPETLVVSQNTTGFSVGAVPLYRLSTNGTGITAIGDYRIAVQGLGPNQGGGALALSQLTDVSLSTSLAGGDILVYDQVTGKWENLPLSVAPPPLETLPDVQIDSSLADQDQLVWDAGLSRWVNATPSGAGPLEALSDVDIDSALADEDVLTWDAGLSKWVNRAPSGGGSFVSRENALINGGMDFWQRGTSFAAIASGAYSADRWIFGNTSAAVATISRSIDVPTVALTGHRVDASLRFDVTTADASVAAGDIVHISQYVEGFRWRSLAQRELKLTFKVKAIKTGIYCVSLRNGGGDRSCVQEYTVNAGSTWEAKEVIFPASPSAGTWYYDYRVGVMLGFAMMGGTTWQTTPGSWQTGNFLTTANQVNNTDTTFGTDFLITDVRLWLNDGSEYLPLDWEAEYEKARRYCVVLGGAVRAALGFGSISSVPTSSYIDIPLPTPMRVFSTPTITVPTLGDLELRSGDTQVAVTGMSASVLSGTANQQNGMIMKVLVTTGSGPGAAKDAVTLEMRNFSDTGIIISNEL